MANIKSKEKNIRKIKKATTRNAVVKSKVRKAIKGAKLAVASGDKDVQIKISLAHKEINTAVSKGVFHKNNGARKISRLDKSVNKA
ncbi:30S ribosomal protein S20 [Candidatus Mycoplasma mahonii]|uniref:30S ribosomal protein S20 n=1 Tax=Candidatus Mycoplasma mahonii TaxID=3004105 RepID=UPI0026EF126D|nr:30S ribosomal protein S20 [Candidatus Mycoplasma mahonii]WKX02319.1 30S ribosomal protein S20 [Candidatus Mycoplasma mahonii]